MVGPGEHKVCSCLHEIGVDCHARLWGAALVNQILSNHGDSLDGNGQEATHHAHVRLCFKQFYGCDPQELRALSCGNHDKKSFFGLLTILENGLAGKYHDAVSLSENPWLNGVHTSRRRPRRRDSVTRTLFLHKARESFVSIWQSTRHPRSHHQERGRDS